MNITIDFVRVHNAIQKPGPVFLKIAQVAYDAGADYLYRVNDDTELIQPWTTQFIKILEVRFIKSSFSSTCLPTDAVSLHSFNAF